jgi:hypothetical protein
VGVYPLPRTLRLDGCPDGTFLTRALGAMQVLLADLLTVAAITDLSGLRLCVLLAHAVLANQVWRTPVHGIAKMALTSEGTVALL